MIPRAAKDAGHAIARIMWEKKESRLKNDIAGRSDYSAFEEIWDEISAGHATYGMTTWTRWIKSRPSDTDYWYKRVRSICFDELAKKERNRIEQILSTVGPN